MQKVIDYIIEKLQTIDGIDNIYQALPYAKGKKELEEQFLSFLSSNPDDLKNFQAWEVSNSAGIELTQNGGNLANWQDTISIHGWLKFPQSAQMQIWVDAIKHTFKGNQKLGKTVLSRGTLRLIISQPDWFYSYLCHHIHFDMTVQSIL